MDQPLKVLILDDSPDGSEVLLQEIRRAGFRPEWKRARDEEAYLRLLGEDHDLILAYYLTPHSDLLRALAAVRERELEVPFIVVSGARGEDLAVAAMRAGAADYLLKDGLSRLGASIRGATGQREEAAKRRRRERQLRESEERFRLAAQSATDVIFDWDTVADSIEICGGAGKRLGFDAADLPRNLAGLMAIVHPDDRNRVMELVAEAVRNHARYDAEYRVVARDGSIRHWACHAQMIARPDGTATRMLGVVTDLTDQVMARERISSMNVTLLDLSARLMRSQDEERRRFARELHDSTAQSLTALSFSLSLLSNLPALADLPDAKKMLQECVPTVENCIREVRTMSYLLHPLLMDDLGLESALRNFVSGFQRRTALSVHFQASTDRQRWPDPVQTAAFRFVQEALSNVHRHARASEVHVRVVESRTHLTVVVRDNGRGFPPHVLDESGTPVGVGVGIAGMWERARHLGGGLMIQSKPEGSCLQMVIPIDEDD